MARDYMFTKSARITGISVDNAIGERNFKERLKANEAKRSFCNQQGKLKKEIEQIINNGIYNPKEIIEILKEKYPDVVEEKEKVIITMPNGEQVGRLTAQILDKINTARELAQKLAQKSTQKSTRENDEGR